MCIAGLLGVTVHDRMRIAIDLDFCLVHGNILFVSKQCCKFFEW
jgi:hypothetical protein